MFRGDKTGTGASILLALLLEAKFWEILEARDRELAWEAQTKGCQVCDGKLDVGNYPRKDRGLGASGLPLAGIRLSFCCRVRGCRKRHTPPSVRFLGRRVYFGAIIILACVAKIGETSPSAAAEPESATLPAGPEPEPESVTVPAAQAQEVPPPEVSPTATATATAVSETATAMPTATATTTPTPEPGSTVTPAAPRPTRFESSSTATAPFGVPDRTMTRWRRWWREDFPKSQVWQELRGLLLPPIGPEALPGGLLGRYAGTLQEQVLQVLELLLPLSATGPRPAPW